MHIYYYYIIHNVNIYIYKISRSNYIQPSLQTWRSATWSSNKLNDSCTVFEPIARFAITIIYNLENNGPSLKPPLKQKKIRWNLNEDSALPATGEHAVPWTWSESLHFSIGIYTWPMYSLARANLYRRNRLDSNLKAIVIQFKY